MEGDDAEESLALLEGRSQGEEAIGQLERKRSPFYSPFSRVSVSPPMRVVCIPWPRQPL